MSEPHAEDGGAILERNLRALFERAYVQVPIRPGFAQQVQAAAAGALRPAPPPTSIGPRLLFAAAASFLLGFFLFAAWQRSDSARDRILARGDVALRSERGAWLGLEVRGGSALPLQLGGDTLELQVPGEIRAAIGMPDGGAIAVSGPAALRCAPSGSGATLEVQAGSFALREFSGRVRGAFGLIECAGADLDLSSDGACAQALLGRGLARFEARDGARQELARGAFFETCPADPALAFADVQPGVLALTPTGDSRVAQPAPPGPAAAAGASPASLSGSVRDGDGHPLQAFRVILLRELELPRTASPQSFEFAATGGAFELQVQSPGSWTVFVQAEGFALWTRESLSLGERAQSLEVVLEPGAALAGRVLDAQSGMPLAGAVVVSEGDVPSMLLSFDLDDCPSNPAALTRSDAQGRFRLEHLARRPTVLRAVHRGFAPQWSAPIVPGADAGEIELRMEHGGAVAGRVEREDGSPWAGVGIVAMPQRSLFGLPRRSHGQALCDASGAYRIEDLPPGACVVVRVEPVARDGSAQGRPGVNVPRTEVRQAIIAADATVAQDFLASPRGSRWTGRVLGADGAALAACTVSIVPLGDGAKGGEGIPEGWRSQLCSATGAFEFTDVAPGAYTVYLGVRTPMDIVQVDRIEIARAANLAHDVRASKGELSGRILNQAGRVPLPSAVVVVERERASAEWEFVAKIFSDAAGVWRAPYLADGVFRVRAYPGRGLAWAGRESLEIRNGGAIGEIEFLVAAGSELDLLVRDGQGAALAGVDVRLYDERGGEYTPAEFLRTNPDGSCAISGLPSGRSRLVLRAADGTTLDHWLSVQAPTPLALELRMDLPRK